MTKTCKTCGNYEICIIGYKERRTDCNLWHPPIVHCGECTSYESGRCTNYHGLYGRPKPDDFCSYGDVDA